MRHKAGQVFLQSLKDGASTSKSSVKGGGKAVAFVEDEEAIHRMLKEIDNDQKGDLAKRIKLVAAQGASIITEKEFNRLIVDQLKMSPADQVSLRRVTKFD